MNQTETALSPLLVTTVHRGVFFGYGVPSDAPIIKLNRAKMCVYWSADIKGVLGLAVTGPNTNCKIGPEVSEIILRDVTAIVMVSKVAETQWAKSLWS